MAKSPLTLILVNTEEHLSGGTKESLQEEAFSWIAYQETQDTQA